MTNLVDVFECRESQRPHIQIFTNLWQKHFPENGEMHHSGATYPLQNVQQLGNGEGQIYLVIGKSRRGAPELTGLCIRSDYQIDGFYVAGDRKIDFLTVTTTGPDGSTMVQSNQDMHQTAYSLTKWLADKTIGATAEAREKIKYFVAELQIAIDQRPHLPTPPAPGVA
ncbi:MAG: hypothetical protein DI551_10360 [Micavibrio aeruginosavorus]|uniref:Uncharacterized protein n=1 Tax=Micavibrio aeruginosavorus TaxID=349221 RepID=A0A2W5MST7_9BACT|nr:MAG: hypothetical protein DI551_10360 [Micavibrio aeruginosavorus]